MINSELLTMNTKKLYHKYLAPAIAGALAVSVYSLVDTIAMGQYAGPAGAAAVAIINPLFAFNNFSGMLLGIGSSVLIGRAKGEGNQAKADRIFTLASMMAVVVSILLWFINYVFLDPLLIFFGADQELLPLSREYALVFATYTPVFILPFFYAPIVQVDENPKLVLWSTLIAGAINIWGDWYLVFPMDMGLKGAAVATVIGAFIQTVITVIHFGLKRNTMHFARPQGIFRNSWKIINSGFGASILDVAIGIMTIIVNQQTMKYGGTDELAVFGVIMTISFLLQHVFAGVGQAAQPIIATNLGAMKTDRIWESYRLMFRSSIIFGAISFLFCWLLPTQILRVFIDVTDNVLKIGPHIVKVYAAGFVFMSININLIFFVQSIMKARPALIMALSRGLFVGAALLYILPLFMGFDGIIWAQVLVEIIVMIFAVPYVSSIRRKGLLN